MDATTTRAAVRRPAYTPGEWVIDLDTPFSLGGDERSVEALSPDGRMVTREVAHLLFDTDDHPDGPGWKEDAANARLIANAPRADRLIRLLAAEFAANNRVNRAWLADGERTWEQLANEYLARVDGA